MADKPRIGILGMGTMGGPMARRLVDSGFTVTGYEPDQTRAGKAKADGVTLASSPARVAEASDMVLSSLPTWPRCAALTSQPTAPSPARGRA